MNSLKDFIVNGDKKIKLKNFATTPDDSISKEKIVKKTKANLEEMEKFQDKLYSEGKEGLVLIFQAMDAAGKDSTIKNVMSGLNPQGIDVHSFKQPSGEEAAHSFLWRAIKRFPTRGKMAIFNRSYYEDVLVVKVHKLYETAKMPNRCKQGDIIERRYKDIKNFEEYEYNNGYRIIKFFLNVSKDEQKKRFLERIDLKIKNWKFSSSDLKERAHWDKYMQAYEDAINATASEHSPWYVLPADKKWYTRYLVSEAVLDVFKKIAPQYPKLDEDAQKRLQADREILMSEENS
ncbi:MAG: polyphosphate kinase 2 family protein [Ruminococcus sp.]|nr:polyphosphate kinase 2 family protein [Ruminococcus sp.]